MVEATPISVVNSSSSSSFIFEVKDLKDLSLVQVIEHICDDNTWLKTAKRDKVFTGIAITKCRLTAEQFNHIIKVLLGNVHESGLKSIELT